MTEKEPTWGTAGTQRPRLERHAAGGLLTAELRASARGGFAAPAVVLLTVLLTGSSPPALVAGLLLAVATQHVTARRPPSAR